MVVLVILALLITIAIPYALRARHTARARSCVCNMRQVDCAKQQWAMEYNKVGTSVPAWVDIEPYISSAGAQPLCPEGNIAYVLTEANAKTVCTNVDSYPDHVQQ